MKRKRLGIANEASMDNSDTEEEEPLHEPPAKMMKLGRDAASEVGSTRTLCFLI